VAVPIRDLVAMLVDAAALPPDTIEVQDVEVQSKGGDWTRSDIRLAAELLDWRPTTGLDTSLRDMWQAAAGTARHEGTYSTAS
jgi:nucleoside-diphosphate-sugar epimerase